MDEYVPGSMIDGLFDLLINRYGRDDVWGVDLGYPIRELTNELLTDLDERLTLAGMCQEELEDIIYNRLIAMPKYYFAIGYKIQARLERDIFSGDSKKSDPEPFNYSKFFNSSKFSKSSESSESSESNIS